ncbi:hypothetical protein C0992_007911 [Termitomyces sp. T32_za158]|nr:hypothetical protein C0992_007911 [Termitomyces sp. T32_za158]
MPSPMDPLFAFAFIQAFIDILNEYLGNVSAATLKDNFDVVYQLLEETLDSGGHPLTTSSNALRDIVLPPSLLTKILSVAGANITPSINSGSGLGSGPFSSPIPWRKAGLRYASNEIYFDMVEELKAIVNRFVLQSCFPQTYPERILQAWHYPVKYSTRHDRDKLQVIRSVQRIWSQSSILEREQVASSALQLEGVQLIDMDEVWKA